MSTLEDTWVDVCALDDLLPGRGVAALVDGLQVALFRLGDGDDVVAVANRDPFSGANVIARGLTGSKADVDTVASPIYKQRFDLRTGRCLDDPAVRLAVFVARVDAGRVVVRTP